MWRERERKRERERERERENVWITHPDWTTNVQTSVYCMSSTIILLLYTS